MGEKRREKEEQEADSCCCCCCCCLKRVFPYKKQVFHISLCRVCVSSRSCCCCCATSNRSRFLYQRRHRRYFSLHLLCCSSSSSFSLDFYLFALACFTSLYSVGRDAVAVCCYFPDIVFPLLLPLSLVVFSFASTSTSSRICLPCIRPWRFVLFSFYILFIGFCVLCLLLLRLRFLHLFFFFFFFLCSAVASVSPSFLALFSSCVQLI